MNDSTNATTSNTNDFDGKCWDEVKQYILNCPYVSNNHPSITVAIKAVDLERQRQERDAKLRRKFSNKTTGTTTATAVGVVRSNNATDEEPVMVMYDTTTKPINTTRTIIQHPNKSMGVTAGGDDRMMTDDHNDDDDDDWQDVNREEEQKVPMGGTGTIDRQDADTNHDDTIGNQLAKITVSLLGSNHATVQSPLAAIAIAFHAMLVCPMYQFVCTGIPEPNNNNKTTTIGFAAPIRDLPKTQFVPTKWETINNNTTTNITIRYRKIDSSITTRILNVSMVDNGTISNGNSIVEVLWVSPSALPSTTKTTTTTGGTGKTSNEAIPSVFRFELQEHFNNESWTKALQTTTSPSPILHYKHLYVLLSKFCQHFDFGTVYDSSNGDKTMDASAVTTTTTSIPYNDYTVQQLPTRMNGITNPITTTSAAKHMDSFITDPLRIPTRNEMHRGFGGDFDADLYHPVIHQNNPGDPFRPIIGGGGGMVNPTFPGNLMGPNHPSFRNPFPLAPNHNNDPAYHGFGGMKPRFDPYGPPPTNPDTSNVDGSCRNNGLPDGLQPNHGFGPNPDHLRPPTFGTPNNTSTSNTSNMFM